MRLRVKSLGKHPGEGGSWRMAEKVAICHGPLLQERFRAPPTSSPGVTMNMFHYLARGTLQVKLRLIIN